ncbi:hypothetical protein [Alcaligenes sp. Marseille-Q7550]
MTSAFENLAGPGKPLRAEPPDKKEFEGLIRSGHARLRDALNTTLSLESRFDLAYNAAHALCLAAVRLCAQNLKNLLLKKNSKRLS